MLPIKLKQRELLHQIKRWSDKADFTAAMNVFALTHSELISFHATLRVDEIVNKAMELNAASQEMNAASEEIFSSIQQINASMQEVRADSERGLESLDQLDQRSAETKKILGVMVDNYNELSKQITNIESISQNVADIADQTNLLALNAAIEAARAGEKGRGFNVVAEEVRKLAGQTKDAVDNVKQISNEMNVKSAKASENIAGVQKTFNEYLENVGQVEDVIRGTTRQTDECTVMLENITNAAQQLKDTAENLATIAEKLTENTRFVSELLSHEAEGLVQLVQPVLKLSQEESEVKILAVGLIDHAHFLKQTMQNAGKGVRVTSHTECAFGKWYAANKDRFKHVEVYTNIDEPHRQVHLAAEEMVKECTPETVEDLMRSSLAILKAFIDLYSYFMGQDVDEN